MWRGICKSQEGESTKSMTTAKGLLAVLAFCACSASEASEPEVESTRSLTCRGSITHPQWEVPIGGSAAAVPWATALQANVCGAVVWDIRGKSLLESTHISVCADANGVANGPVSGRHPDGSIFVRGQCHKGRAVGRWEQWLDGRLVRVSEYKAGKLHGEWTVWRRSGELFEQGRFFKGRKVGTWKYWDVRGIPPRLEIHRLPVEAGFP